MLCARPKRAAGPGWRSPFPRPPGQGTLRHSAPCRDPQLHNITADPRRLTAGFLRAALGRGARLYSPVKVIDVGRSATAQVWRRRAAPRFAQAMWFSRPATSCQRACHGKGTPSPRPGHSRRGRSPQNCGQCVARSGRRPIPICICARSRGRVICGGEDEEFSDEATRDAMMDARSRDGAKLARLLPRIDAPPSLPGAAASADRRPVHLRSDRCHACRIAMPCSAMAATGSRFR